MAQIPDDIKSIRTGVLRRDIELIPPGKHGPYPMIFDPAAESYYKVSFSAYQMLKHCTRDRSIGEFCRHLSRAGFPADPEEVLLLKQFLIQNNLLIPDAEQFSAKLANHRKAKGKYVWLKFASAYLYFKLPPLHPQPLIDKLKPYLHFLGSPVFFWLLAIPALLGYCLAFRDFSNVLGTFKASFSWAGLVKYFFAIILLKIVHESGHLAGNVHFNCRIRSVGISVIFLYPRFFSDTTDSWRLAPHQRLLIDAGGLLAEVICGGLAALLWCYLPPGKLQSTMFFIFSTSTVTTLLVNGNPLIRFDGYYILCDLLKVENLMSRSSSFLRQWSRCLIFGVGAPPQEERPFLMAGFGVAAFVYRFLLYTSIILLIYNTMIKAVAVILLLLEVFSIFIFPLQKISNLFFVFSSPICSLPSFLGTFGSKPTPSSIISMTYPLLSS